jgi:hypothetical protein
MPASVPRKHGHHRRRIAVLTEPVSLSQGQQPFTTLKTPRRTPTDRHDKTPAEKYGSTLAPTYVASALSGVSGARQSGALSAAIRSSKALVSSGNSSATAARFSRR